MPYRSHDGEVKISKVVKFIGSNGIGIWVQVAQLRRRSGPSAPERAAMDIYVQRDFLLWPLPHGRKEKDNRRELPYRDRNYLRLPEQIPLPERWRVEPRSWGPKGTQKGVSARLNLNEILVKNN